MIHVLQTTALFFITAIAEILGCYLFYLWFKKGASPLLLLPSAVSLALFAWLLTMHPTAAGRVYAAYGGAYVFVALLWLRFIDGIAVDRWDVIGGMVSLAGMAIIMFMPRQ